MKRRDVVRYNQMSVVRRRKVSGLLMPKPMKFFVSYSRSVQKEVKKVVDLLRAAGHEV